MLTMLQQRRRLSPAQVKVAALLVLFPFLWRLLAMALKHDKSLVEHTAAAIEDTNRDIEASLRKRGELAGDLLPGTRKTLTTPPGIVASMCQQLGVRLDDGMLSDLLMLEHRGDFQSCRQPADYVRLWLRLKLQQTGEG